MSVGNTLSGHIILAERLNYEERTRYLVVVQANVSQLKTSEVTEVMFYIMYIISNPNHNPYPYILIPYPNNHNNNTLKWNKFCYRDNHYPPTNPIFCLFPAWGSRSIDPLAQKAVTKGSRTLTGTFSKVGEVQFASLGKLYEKNWVLHLLLLHDSNNYRMLHNYESTVLTIKIFQKNQK